MASPIPKYKTPEELADKMQEYFDECNGNGDIPNICGMAVFCGFASRSSFCDYEAKSKGFLHVIKKAKSQLYNEKFQKAAKGEMDKTIFIFDAVNNHDMFNTRSENKNDTNIGGQKDNPVKWEVEVVHTEAKNIKKEHGK